ncbi:biosynthetic arginine decarboxylase [Halomonas daqingensis]|uniref:Biosynthetic arginine decarboxylase n=2 Tax=Billgrantia desiderata TaxID=52021 RepID=A0AAW4YWT3_9GAMM|nr:biosynthetic arginine decarboxylase [Halomonas desiderata]OUE45482.1 arginine decarboxylase [Halomonas desiderata SP1]MCE8014377.1 biosynthetic arginine decarboxylase [Halomonas desiderata]MCE8031193.1 biosynthetic arginine decarboxylase [Halomonas desiderata]MCE8044039.1 biosynthetic arginine decarboxylase [Halomonas desiderata]MCE8048613.1 biosynthetic arginine decarboxylase [Halomonas desiderata]
MSLSMGAASGPAQRARRTWNIDQWGSGYFDVDDDGHALVRPLGSEAEGPALPLAPLVDQLREADLRLPVLVRFSDILHDRVEQLCEAFDLAMREEEYVGGYTAVYPIKVNQQRRVVEEILATRERGHGRVGLEAGSKPELLAVLALSADGPSLIVCNGYKDREYIRLALMGEKLGHRVYLVVEKFSELPLILEEAERLGVTPRIGLRARLASVGMGKWQDTGGEKSKFGLTAAQMLAVVERLREADSLGSLQLVHFHLGSQIANIRDIQVGLRECARFYQSLLALGAPIDTVDVGGGLGIDYEGTRSRSFCSINYSMREYARNVVSAFAQACNEAEIPHPHLISESGRALTAHHAVLITNVIGEERVNDAAPERLAEDDPQLDELWRVHDLLNGSVEPRELVEAWHDLLQAMSEMHDRFLMGLADITVRAEAEGVYFAACARLRERLDSRNRAHREIIDELAEKLADKLFVNFSLFQSVPDVWGIDQIFPVLPLTGLNREPSRRGVIQDITCDSDGRIDGYVDGQGVETTLPLPEWRDDEERLLGFFLVGAYQEILGDLHNLFGDTDSVDAALDVNGEWVLSHAQQGDRVSDVLAYVNFDAKVLRDRLAGQLADSGLPAEEQEHFLDDLSAGLQGYTYLE